MAFWLAGLSTVGGLAVSADTSKLTYFTWAGYTDPAFQKAYNAKYGAGPKVVYFSGTDDAFIRLEAGFQADVAHPCLPDVKKWKDAGLLQPLDPSKIASWNEMFPTLRDSPAVMIDGKPWMLPWEWGFSSVIYRTDKVKFAEQTLRVMIDPQYKGRTTFPDVFDEVFQLAALLAGIQSPLNMSEGDYPKIEGMLRTLRDNARFMWTDAAQIEQAMASGEVVVAWGWTNTAKNLKRQGLAVDFMLTPKEKLATWVCGLAYLKNSTAPRQEVYDFINAVESREAGIAVVDKFGFGHSNREAMKAVPKAELDALGFGGDVSAVLNRGKLVGPMSESQRKRLIDMWETVKAGG
jgi:putative spermidine/putrescine transport system substrate-binding protein/spermidine/putrescine transport system substrate-binding protein